MRLRFRHLAGLLLAVTAVTAVAGCGTTSDQTSKIALAALATRPQEATSKTAKPATLCTASLRPPATLPAAGNMPPGSFMATIKKRGYLIAGVNAAQLNFGYFNPRTGKIEGFEIDLIREIARAIFGNPNAYTTVALTVGQKEDYVRQNKVDIVAATVTMTCTRSRLVDFSAVYYDAKQRVLVPSTSGAKSIDDLAGKRVCATGGSTPVYVMQHDVPRPPDVFPAAQAIDCLVYLQQGRIAGISTDSSILVGIVAQDPNTRIVGPPIADVPYGMEISQAHPGFVRFVNGVLAELERNGTWQQLQAKWLGHFGQLEAPPKPQYGG